MFLSNYCWQRGVLLNSAVMAINAFAKLIGSQLLALEIA